MKLDFDAISNAAFLKEVVFMYGEEFVNDNVTTLSKMYALSRSLVYRDGVIDSMRNNHS